VVFINRARSSYGRKKPDKENISKICLLAFSLLIIVPSVFLCSTILTKIGQQEKVVELVSSYVKSLIPYIITSIIFKILYPNSSIKG
jgi:Na+-driven multidrug efflux pump